MSEGPDEPVVEVEAEWIARPSTASFFFRSDGDGAEDETVPPEADETRVPPGLAAEGADWRAERLQQVLRQRGERHGDGDDAVFRLPWSELLKAMSRVLHEVEDGAHVDRRAQTAFEIPVANFDADSETLCTPGAQPGASGEETAIQSSPQLVAAQQEAAYLEGKLARAEEIRLQLTEQLSQAEAATEAANRYLEQERARLERDVAAARQQAEQLHGQLHRVRAQVDEAASGSQQRLADAEGRVLEANQRALEIEQEAAEQVADAERERDAARAELSAAREEADQAQAALLETEQRYEAARTDSASVRKRFLQTRQDLDERIDALEEELARRSAGHERERASLVEEQRETEQMLRDLFGKLPEDALRGWVPGLADEAWTPDTAMRHLSTVLDRLEGYRRERRQARLLPIPDFAAMRGRLAAGRADVGGAAQPRLARLGREIDAAEERFEVLREKHLGPRAKLQDLLELNAVVATALGYERELGALGL